MDNDYLEFKSPFDIHVWMIKNYESFLNETHKNSNNSNTLGDALFAYTGSMSKTYNIILDFNDGNINNIDEIIKKYYKSDDVDINTKRDILLIYKAFTLNEITDNIILFHYFDKNFFENNMKVGSVFQINHFISTTLLKDNLDIKNLGYQKNYNSVLIIKAKKGTPCIPIYNNPKSRLKEYEMILKPKSKFMIKRKRNRIFSKINSVIECELISS